MKERKELLFHSQGVCFALRILFQSHKVEFFFTFFAVKTCLEKNED